MQQNLGTTDLWYTLETYMENCGQGLGERSNYLDHRIIFVAIISWPFDIGMVKQT